MYLFQSTYLLITLVQNTYIFCCPTLVVKVWGSTRWKICPGDHESSVKCLKNALKTVSLSLKGPFFTSYFFITLSLLPYLVFM